MTLVDLLEEGNIPTQIDNTQICSQRPHYFLIMVKSLDIN